MISPPPAARDIWVVLDDDPTGTQPIGEIPVLTRWTDADLRWAMHADTAGFYVLTNTRALDAAAAAQRIHEISTRILRTAAELNRTPHFVSRGDSTLRGHFPLEVDAVSATLHEAGRDVGLVLLVPAYPQAGRVTRQGIHYAGTESPVPVAETEFARDRTFGYRNSELSHYIAEKTDGRVRADTVAVITSREIRTTPVGELARRFETLASGTRRAWAAIDAETEADLQRIGAAVRRAAAHRAQIVCQSGPGLMPALLGQHPAPALRALPASPGSRTPGGLIVVGSHVSTATRQLQHFLNRRDTEVHHVEVEVADLIDPSTRLASIEGAAAALETALRTGTAVLSTTRRLRAGSDAEHSLRIAQTVSSGLVAIVRAAVRHARPAYVVAKGGITSSDIATEALGISRATALGPVLPGIISAWLPHNGLLPGRPYVVFAGNVGDDSALTEVVSALQERGES